jgi:hypothetical protein
MKSGNNMSFSFCEDEKWKYDANDKQGNLRRLWGYGKTKIPSRRPATETNLSEPDASATVIKNKHLPRINTELHGITRKEAEAED